jgi:hypothetical protein
MNIFYLDSNPQKCAEYHMDRHSIKMVLEYCQLLSTAHRVLDGVQTVGLSESGRKKTVYHIVNDNRNDILYSATHINHPSAVWVRKSAKNYMHLVCILVHLCKEYTYRYGKIHKCESSGLVYKLGVPPNNISYTEPFTEPTPAMPDEVKVKGDSISSYRNYYIKNKQHLASWQGKINSRNVPEWFTCLHISS